MEEQELKERFRQYSIRIVRMVDSIPTKRIAALAIAKQVIRSGTSPAANYRAACVAKSKRDFLNKLKMVEEELDETRYWLELMVDTDIFPKEKLDALIQETIELLNIIVKSIVSTRYYLSQHPE
ncbi:MAG: four helix bundle protein [Paludibacteraceae bacterium]|nr:four helix bundle protein [Paludibacteraceae bacterium]